MNKYYHGAKGIIYNAIKRLEKSMNNETLDLCKIGKYYSNYIRTYEKIIDIFTGDVLGNPLDFIKVREELRSKHIN